MAEPISPTMLQKLAAMLGGGQAGKNVQAAQNPEYTNYAREAQAMGGKPLPFEQWKAQQMTPQPMQQPAPQQQPAAPPQPFRF